ncbi:MAG TPA: hypothetical protein VGI92_04895 [Gemmatimonadales bacterium]|jgi:hypothetical protein
MALAAACAPAHRAAAQAGPAGPAAAQDPSLPPPGFGSLRQDDIGIRLDGRNLLIRIIPLDEKVIRLLAPDSYRSLHDMRESHAEQIKAASRPGMDSAEVFMVTFFGLQPQTRFNPDELQILSQNATYRPVGYVAITPRFSENQVGAREQAAAIFVYEPGIEVLRPFTVTYNSLQSDSWNAALTLLNTERARVLARSQAQTRP